MTIVLTTKRVKWEPIPRPPMPWVGVAMMLPAGQDPWRSAIVRHIVETLDNPTR